MLTIWGRTNSSNVMKVLWLLEELGAPYERIDAGMQHGRTGTADYRAMNPMGLVPTLREADGFSLFESNAILRHLGRTQAGGARFYPQAARDAAVVDAWLDFQQTALTPVQSPLFHALVRVPPAERDPAAVAGRVADAARVWGMVDARLAERGHVALAALSLADMALGPHAHRWFTMDMQRPDLPHLRDWYDRLLARPAYARTCAGPLS